MALKTAREIYEAVVSGRMTGELRGYVEQLPGEERRDLLRVLWFVRDEVAEQSQDQAVEIDHLVANNCEIAPRAERASG